jgi:hypothetical protein
MFKIARAQTLLALWGTTSGYWFTVFFMDIITMFAIQLSRLLLHDSVHARPRHPVPRRGTTLP